MKKLLLGLSTITPLISIGATVSCNLRKKSYDIGFAMSPVTTLNYIKYKSSIPFAHSLVESFFKSAPTFNEPLFSYMKNIGRMWSSHPNTTFDFTKRLVSATSGNLRLQYNGTEPRPNDKNSAFSYDVELGEETTTTALRLNGKSEWANGDKVTSSNYIDAFVYILDLNSGSQNYSQLLKMDIKNARQFVDAQTIYSKKMKKLYKNPFGYIKNPNYDAKDKTSSYYIQMPNDSKNKFPLQVYKENDPKGKVERKLVDDIEKYARNLGIFGDNQSSHPYANMDTKTFSANEKTFFDKSVVDSPEYQVIQKLNNKEIKHSPYVLELQTARPVASIFEPNSLLSSPLLPVNRKFVESIGGVEKFGLSEKTFLTQGPFKIQSMILGSAGSFILKKNNDYFDSKNTIPNKVKIFMQGDLNVLSALFEDGYISSTKIDALTAKKFYSQTKYRNMLRKNNGQGSTALVFNLDPKSPGYNKLLGDRDLRKAIQYVIDREEIIKLSGFDATMPIYAFSDINSTNANYVWDGARGGTLFSEAYGNSVYKDKEGPKTSLFPYASVDLSGGHALLGNFNKTDKMKNVKIARKYFNKFLRKNNLTHATITFNSDSTTQMNNIGLAIQTQLKKAFGGKLKLKIKGYPKSVYDTYFNQGNFQFTFRNLDYLSGESTGGMDSFMMRDGIDKKRKKLIGYLTNPTGTWTPNKIIKHKVNNLTPEEKEVKKRLNISDLVWNKIYEYINIEKNSAEQDVDKLKTIIIEKIQDLFNRQSKDENFDTTFETMGIIEAMNKLIFEDAPIIPTFIVDVKLSIIRMAGYSIGSGPYGYYSYDYAYDLNEKPIPGLPGREALIS